MLCIVGDEWMGGWMEVCMGLLMWMGLLIVVIFIYNRVDGMFLVL